MLFDNAYPRYLPHLDHPEVLQMGLSPLGESPWIETDNDIGDYHRHKIEQRRRLGDGVYRARPDSLPAQRELAEMLSRHLCDDQGAQYRMEGSGMHCVPGGFSTPLDSPEPLWNCSLWVADDLVLMTEIEGKYRLAAASLCSPSHWRLRDKFDRPLREIHDPIPDFHRVLTPRIDRFFDHLKPEHPVVRYNWSLQGDDRLNQGVDLKEAITPDTRLYYRSERQSLARLPRTGAVAFTIRVYLHRLESLARVPGALPALFSAIDSAPPALARYKGFDLYAPALASYRRAGLQERTLTGETLR